MKSLTAFEIAYACAVVLLAYGLRGSTGFGGAAGMPLLALVIPIKTLVPAWTLLGIASSIAILGRDRRHVALREFVAFMPWCAVGVVVGLYLFKMLDAHTLARGLGVLVLFYGAHALWTTLRPAAPWRLPARVAGPAAGTLSGAVATMFGTMGSLFFVMYLEAWGLAKTAFRATMSAMLLTLSALRGIGYFAVGEFTAEAWIVFAAAFPLMLAGIYLGDRIHVRISELAFRRLVAATLIGCGVLLLR